MGMSINHPERALRKIASLLESQDLRQVARSTRVDYGRLRKFYKREIAALTPIEHDRVMDYEQQTKG